MPTQLHNTILLATDQQRSVLNAFDPGPLHSFAYTPYGHRPLENSLLSLLGFNGERPDPVTGCYFLGNGYRAFNPVLMRFVCPDSWSPFGEGGLNAYTYCVGDPVNRTDQNGHAGLFRMLMSLGKTLGLRHSSRMTRANDAFETAIKEFPSTQRLSSVASVGYSDARQISSRSSISSGSSKISSVSSNYESLPSSRKSFFTQPKEKLGPRAPLPMGVKSKTEWSYPKPDYSHQNIYEELQPRNAHNLVSRSIYNLNMQLFKEQQILDLLTSPQAREIKNISTIINNIRIG